MSDKNKNTVNKLSGLSTGCSTYLRVLYTYFFSRQLNGLPGYCLEMIHATKETSYHVAHNHCLFFKYLEEASSCGKSVVMLNMRFLSDFNLTAFPVEIE